MLCVSVWFGVNENGMEWDQLWTDLVPYFFYFLRNDRIHHFWRISLDADSGSSNKTRVKLEWSYLISLHPSSSLPRHKHYHTGRGYPVRKSQIMTTNVSPTKIPSTMWTYCTNHNLISKCMVCAAQPDDGACNASQKPFCAARHILQRVFTQLSMHDTCV